VLARLTPLSPARDRELGELQRWLLDELHQHGKDNLEWLAESDLASPEQIGIPGIDEQKVHRLAELNHQVIHSSRCRCAVVSVPASTANP
jgi:hypothetical protein